MERHEWIMEYGEFRHEMGTRMLTRLFAFSEVPLLPSQGHSLQPLSRR